MNIFQADSQQENPVMHCKKCGGEIYSGETVFNWNNEGFICLECFKAAVNKILDLDPQLVSTEMGVEYKEV